MVFSTCQADGYTNGQGAVVEDISPEAEDPTA